MMIILMMTNGAAASDNDIVAIVRNWPVQGQQHIVEDTSESCSGMLAQVGSICIKGLNGATRIGRDTLLNVL